MEALEAELTQMRASFTTRRLAITDDDGERITLTVDEYSVAELAVMAKASNRATAVTLEADTTWGL